MHITESLDRRIAKLLVSSYVVSLNWDSKERVAWANLFCPVGVLMTPTK